MSLEVYGFITPQVIVFVATARRISYLTSTSNSGQGDKNIWTTDNFSRQFDKMQQKRTWACRICWGFDMARTAERIMASMLQIRRLRAKD
jgi:hypothetical protein